MKRAASLAEKLAHYSMPEPSGCLLWTGAVARHGYGCMRWDGRTQASHRLAWVAANGAIPPEMAVLHRCDVRACINPDHLFLGTQADNMADRDAKGRVGRGETNGLAKLTQKQVLEIRADGRRRREIAAEHGICTATVSRIRRRRAWAHVPTATA